MELRVVFYILLFISAASAQQLDLSVCGKTHGCMKIPDDCTTTLNCEAVVRYQYNATSGKILIELATKNNWVAFAQKPTSDTSGSNMRLIRGQYCARTEPVSMGNLNGNDITDYGQPQWKDKVEGVTSLSMEVKDGVILCRFQRPVKPPESSSDWLYNFGTAQLKAVMAYGSNLDSNHPSYHGNGKYSSSAGAVDFLNFQSTEVTTTATTTTTITSTPFTTKATIDLSLCGITYGCILVPNTCTTASTCEAIVRHQYDSTKQEFIIELVTKNNWVALAHKPSGVGKTNMQKIRGQYCARTSPVSMGNLNGNDIENYGQPQWKDKVDGVKTLDTQNTNGIIVCRFTLVSIPPASSSDWLYNFNTTKLITVIAYGSNLEENNPSYHGNGKYSTLSSVDYFANAIVSLNNGRKAKPAEITHGCFMIIAWVLFATTAIFMARYMKIATKEKIVLGKPAWFTVHASLMVLCVICFVIGLIIILTVYKKIDTGNTHHMLGLFTVIAGLIQPVMAIFRPAPEHEKRFIFNWAHRTVGILAWTLAGSSIIFGLRIFGQNILPIIIFMIIIVCLFVLLDIMAAYSSKSNDGATVLFKEMSDYTSITPNVKKTSDATLQWMFLVVIVSLASGFAIYHIYIVATLDII